MIIGRQFVLITSADFLVRSAYQVGKTPLLPIFAAYLGADAFLLGMIVSISTISGIILKPLFGVLSDYWGRRIWLVIGTAVFTLIPFVYHFVGSPEHLLIVRVVHGLATAIYGPVTLAYVAEISPHYRAERIGWFNLGRNAGYVIGPLAAGGLLLIMDPVAIFTVIGIVSAIAFIPVIFLPETVSGSSRYSHSLSEVVKNTFKSLSNTFTVWVVALIEAQFLLAKYSVKTFMPLQALSLGISPVLIGFILAVQEAANLVLSPVGGRLGDRIGYVKSASIGIVCMAAAVVFMSIAETGLTILGSAMLMGAAQAAVFPSTIAMLAAHTSHKHIGAGMGVVGTFRNTAKVLGPVLCGLLIDSVGFTTTLVVIGTLVLSALLVLLRKPSGPINIPNTGTPKPTSSTV